MGNRKSEKKITSSISGPNGKEPNKKEIAKILGRWASKMIANGRLDLSDLIKKEKESA